MKRTCIPLTATAAAPTHIGSGQPDWRTDAPIKLTPDGTAVIPGTTVAGYIRALLREQGQMLGVACTDRESCSCPACQIMGSQGRAASLDVGDLISESAATEIRDHVGKDREHLVARKSILFDQEVSLTDVAFNGWLVFTENDSTSLDSTAHKALQAALRSLFNTASSHRLGGKKSAGQGAVTFSLTDGASAFTLDLNDPQVLREWLLADRPDEVESRQLITIDELQEASWVTSVAPAPAPADGQCSQCTEDIFAPNSISFTLEYEVVDPVLVQGNREPGAIGQEGWSNTDFPGGWNNIFDVQAHYRPFFPNAQQTLVRPERDFEAVPVTASTAGGNRRCVLPGSSIKGALRTRAERIIRTMAGPGAACDPVGDSCGRRLADEEDRLIRQHGRDLDGRMKVARELYRQSCPACRMFGSALMGSRLTVSEACSDNAVTKVFDNLAVDRFTGGALATAKFDTCPVIKGTFSGSLTLERMEPWQVGLLAFLIRDMMDEDLRLGSRTFRGFGRVRVLVKKVRLKAVPGSVWHTMCRDAGVTADDKVVDIAYTSQDDWSVLSTGKVEQPLSKLLLACSEKAPDPVPPDVTPESPESEENAHA